MNLYKSVLKRVLDFFLNLIGLLIASPVLFMVTLLLAIANNGKPFFFQYRPGKNGRIFSIVKFKTMNDRRDSSGNLAAPVDMETGKVNGPGINSDITRTDEAIHPITGKAIEGFQIPFWPKALQMAKDAALHAPENRSVGWDIAITPTGPELIEGNHNWCKLLWQLPVKQGLKEMLGKYK